MCVFLIFRTSRALGRPTLATFVALTLLVTCFKIAFAAGTTGNMNGTVTDAKTSLPVGGVVVDAVSPSGRADARTDAKGFFSFTGLTPDSYTVSFQFAGYETSLVTGVNVFPDGTARVDQKLAKALVTIGHTTARSLGGAFQPGLTNDQYTVTPGQIQTIQGKDNNTNETNLLTSLPGASLDSSGYPVLRGGRENEEGYQFEGVGIVDSFTNQFENSLSINGINNFQLTPGAGNATNGNAGTGTINYTAKRGTYPVSGSIEGDVASFPYAHQFEISYGIASPDSHISNYFSYIGQRDGTQFGQSGIPAAEINEFYNTGAFSEDNLVDNFIYKFGSNKNTELQLLYQNQIDFFQEAYGGGNSLLPTFADPFFTQVDSDPSLLTQFFGISPTELSNAFAPLPGHSNTNPYGYDAIYQPETLYKVQLSHNFSSSAYLRAAYYGVDSVSIFDFPDPFDDFYGTQGSIKHGVSLDFTDQANSKNLLQVGAKFEYNHPIFSDLSQDDASLATALGFLGTGADGFEVADFLPNNAACQGAVAALGGVGPCGTVIGERPGAQIPLYNQDAEFDRADYAAYINDQFAASDRLKFEGGLRIDANNTKYPTEIDGENITIPNDTRNPSVLQPRLAASYQFSKRDAVRASFARSTQFPPLGDASFTVPRSNFAAFNNLPSFDVFTGAPATFCGIKQNLTCPNYGDQLFSEYQAITGPPVQPIKPETFTSYDFSYSHEFPDDVAIKVTPFYTRGYDIVDQVSNVVGVNPTTNAPIFGPALATNDGNERTSGVEFLLTRESQYGFSGQVAATYLNKFSNVPPLSRSEDFFPTIPSASLALGDQYRVGYLSPFQATLAFEYKSRGGLRINPQITYQRGYPYNPGNSTATYINGVPYNLPLTNVTGPTVGSSPPQFVDPVNPGTVFNPNIAANLGTPETRDAGGILSNARLNTNLTIEFSVPHGHSTFGVQITNLFDQLYANIPSLNAQLQPVANGVLGPQSGKLAGFSYPYSVAPYSLPYLSATPGSQGGQSAFVIPQINTPLSALFYYELKI
jgi:TonB dependent receptor/Carboxypeptidase regulatory-like domain